jgi:hypothetical protein
MRGKVSVCAPTLIYVLPRDSPLFYGLARALDPGYINHMAAALTQLFIQLASWQPPTSWQPRAQSPLSYPTS